MKHTTNSTHPLPCAVQLGFAGSRQLFVEAEMDDKSRAQLDAKVVLYLSGCLGRLRQQLRLETNHFLVGMSQMACGADMLFARACLQSTPQPIPQRIVLPQHRAAYLSAIGSNGSPDFTPEQRADAEALLNEKHIIEERVVSHSADRRTQFVDTNTEILRVSDVLICLLRQASPALAGGTNELLERAKVRGTPCLEVRVGLVNGEPTFAEVWHHLDENSSFLRPHLPPELNQGSIHLPTEPLPTITEYCELLKKLVSTQAKGHQQLFKFAAVAIIATHTLATVCATLAVAWHSGDSHHEPFSLFSSGPIPILLIIELIFLAVGFAVHRHLHHSQAARLWAVARVVAELARSSRALEGHQLYLQYLFRLPLPHHFRFLLRTLNVLHLRSTWSLRNDAWQPRRDYYIVNRVDDQIRFYEQRLAEDERRLWTCKWAFTICSLLAIGATLLKLLVTIQSHPPETLLTILGSLAIILPVLAVSGLSWAAALVDE